jgi:RHS repeat-associated protein
MVSTDTSYAYYLNGDLQNIFYPQSGIPNYEFYTAENTAGRVTSAGDRYNNVLMSGTYAPHGALATGYIARGGAYLGNKIYNTYNKRLQPLLLSDSTYGGSPILNLTYNFNLGNGDNGNVIQVANGLDNNRTQNFTYDSLNRLQSAYSSGPSWGETYSIDAWSNLYSRSGISGKTFYEGLSCSADIYNRLSTCYTYDAAGNLIKNGSTTYTYDAENRLIATSNGYSYIYDGDGQRIKKCTTGSTLGGCASNATGTFYWKLADGNTLAESDLGGNFTAAYGVVRGQVWSRVDLPANVIHYYFRDYLNSTSTIADYLGNIQEQSDYYPYGGEIPISGTDANKYKFTGKERDQESGLDFFGFRYYGSNVGRWMSPDPSGLYFSDQSDPQSLNLYGYVRNNPINSIDTDGLLTIVIPGTWWSPKDWNYQNPLVNEATRHFNEHHQTWLDQWNPRGDNDKDRMAAAKGLANFINHYHFAPGETLNIVTHSHGGNVALQAAALGLNHKIDVLITLGAPFGYGSMGPNIRQWYNVTGSGDDVQPSASKGCWTTAGCANQAGAHNMTVQAGSHSALWNNANTRSLWWNWFESQQQPANDQTEKSTGAPPAAVKGPLEFDLMP